jgi:hypothetical protein
MGEPREEPELRELRERVLAAGNVPQHVAVIMDGNGVGPSAAACPGWPATVPAATPCAAPSRPPSGWACAT